MTTETNEDGSPYLPSSELATSDVMPDIDIPITMANSDSADASFAIGDPVSTAVDPKSVYVYANSINPVSSMGDSNVIAFDVVFSVSCTCPEGTTSTYQVVKRIGVDKMKMANDAKMTTPVTIVEAKEPEQFVMNVTTDRFKALAGLK